MLMIALKILRTTLVVNMWIDFCNQYQVVVSLKENNGFLGSYFNATFAECTLMAIRKWALTPLKNVMCADWLKTVFPFNSQLFNKISIT